MLTAMLSWSFEEGRGCCLFMFPYHFTLPHSAYCPMLVIHKVPTQSANEWQQWFWLPLWGLSHPTAPRLCANLQTPSAASQLVIKLWRGGALGGGIHRFSDESPPRSSCEEMTANSILISTKSAFFSSPQCIPLILSNSVTCRSGGWKVQNKCP